MAASLENELRWQSRRGLLELDTVLDKFWQLRAGALSQNDLQALSELLALDDEELWRAICDGGNGLPPAVQKMAGVLRSL